MSDDSTSDMMELEETALVGDAQLEANLRRLREEERKLLERQARVETGGLDDIAALEHQDALRLNQLQQQELQRQQALSQRLALRQIAREAAGWRELREARETRDVREARDVREMRDAREPCVPRRRATCTVRVNNLHSAEAIETDV